MNWFYIVISFYLVHLHRLWEQQWLSQLLSSAASQNPPTWCTDFCTQSADNWLMIFEIRSLQQYILTRCAFKLKNQKKICLARTTVSWSCTDLFSIHKTLLCSLLLLRLFICSARLLKGQIFLFSKGCNALKLWKYSKHCFILCNSPKYKLFTNCKLEHQYFYCRRS